MSLNLLNRMTQKEFLRLLQRYNNGTCTPHEKNTVDNWCENILANDQKTIEFSLEERAKIFEAVKAASSLNHQRSYTRMSLAIAASVIFAGLCLALYFINSRTSSGVSENSSTDLIKPETPLFNNTSQVMAVSLPDGTEVSLYPESKLSMPAFSKAERKIRLEGKAFFKVAHNADRPFLVFTKNLVTKVLGTSFVINARRGAEESVEVKTGKVAVFRSPASGGKSGHQLPNFYVTITPNQQVRLDTIRHQPVKSLVAHPMLIQAPKLKTMPTDERTELPAPPLAMNFEGSPVSEIFKTLEDSYGVEIKYDKDKISNCVLTITMEGEDLFTRLQAVCHAINASYCVDETKIIISSPGCE